MTILLLVFSGYVGSCFQVENALYGPVRFIPMEKSPHCVIVRVRPLTWMSEKLERFNFTLLFSLAFVLFIGITIVVGSIFSIFFKLPLPSVIGYFVTYFAAFCVRLYVVLVYYLISCIVFWVYNKVRRK